MVFRAVLLAACVAVAVSSAARPAPAADREYFQVAYLQQDDVLLHKEVDDGSNPTEMLTMPEGEKWGMISSPRLRKLVMFLRPSDQHRPWIYVHDIDSGKGEKIHQLDFRSTRPIALSPDGAWVAVVDKDDTAGKNTVLAVSVDGKKKALLSSDKDVWDGPAFADSETVLFGTVTSQEMDQALFACQVRGGKPRALLTSKTIPEGQAQERLRPGYTPISLDAHPKSGRVLWLDWGDKTPSVLQVRVTGVKPGPDRYLTECPKNVVCALFSPDGKRIAFFTPAEAIGTDDLMVMKSDGKDLRKISTVNKQSFRGWMFSWSPDSARIAYVHNGSKAQGSVREIYIIDANGGEPSQLTSNQVCECDPAWVVEPLR